MSTKVKHKPFNVPTELVDRLERHRERLKKNVPAVSWSLHDALRLALSAGLDKLEAEAKAQGK